jgi:hypothetical protein
VIRIPACVSPPATDDLRQMLRAQDRFKQTLKALLEPLPDFDDLPEDIRATMCDLIDRLIDRLNTAKETLLKARDAE